MPQAIQTCSQRIQSVDETRIPPLRNNRFRDLLGRPIDPLADIEAQLVARLSPLFNDLAHLLPAGLHVRRFRALGEARHEARLSEIE
jgi:hypothetical protein